MPSISSSPRNLASLAEDYATNPSILKKTLRSRAFASVRSGVNAKKSGAATVATKAVGVLIKKIPVPIVNDLLALAWDKTAEALRKKSHMNKLGRPGVTEADKIKFSLKGLGGTVSNWDKYRWKITHGIEQVNKQTDAAKEMASAPCDQWVKLLAKRLYLRKRMAKLRASVVSVQALCDETLKWLDNVEVNVQANEAATSALYDKDVSQLKKMAHEGCTPEFCMHSTKKWGSRKAVPTANAVAYLNKVGTVADAMSGGARDAAIKATTG